MTHSYYLTETSCNYAFYLCINLTPSKPKEDPPASFPTEKAGAAGYKIIISKLQKPSEFILLTMKLPLAILAFTPTTWAFAPTSTTPRQTSSSLYSESFQRALLSRRLSNLGGAASSSSEATLSDEFVVGILGDLHIDPRKMEDYGVGRSHFLPIFEEGKKKHGNVALVSLGDLGESKSVRPEETSELFAGTSECHEMAAEFLGSFGVEYDVVGGNHDLEGLDEVRLCL